ncbi:MAG: hypothetical protein ACO1O6_06560 [Bacteroidota bacterium]
MAYNEDLGIRIARKLNDLGVRFSEKKMFGGIANDTDLERWINYGLEFGEKSS